MSIAAVHNEAADHVHRRSSVIHDLAADSAVLSGESAFFQHRDRTRQSLKETVAETQQEARRGGAQHNKETVADMDTAQQGARARRGGAQQEIVQQEATARTKVKEGAVIKEGRNGNDILSRRVMGSSLRVLSISTFVRKWKRTHEEAMGSFSFSDELYSPDLQRRLAVLDAGEAPIVSPFHQRKWGDDGQPSWGGKAKHLCDKTSTICVSV